jgi:CheY-like chemotaxis protein
MGANEMLVKRKILVIEDNPDNLHLITYLLKSAGYEPLIAIDGIEGLAVAKRELPNLALCDMQMPNKDGYEVAREFQSDPALRMIPLIAITSYAMVGDRERILAAGFDHYIAKPIRPETFVQEVESLLNSIDPQ